MALIFLLLAAPALVIVAVVVGVPKATTAMLETLPHPFAEAATTTTAATRTFRPTSASQSFSSSNTIVSIPLVPHHVQRRRRRQRHLRQEWSSSRPLLVGVDPTTPSSTTATTSTSTSFFDDHKGSDNHRKSDTHHHGLRHLEASSSSSNNNSNGTQDDEGDHLRQIARLFQGYGTHYVDLWCGQPYAQRQTVIVDTGSGVTAFPCVGCNPDNCGVPKYHLDALYDPSNSTSYHRLDCTECQRGQCFGRNNACQIGMSYQDGSSWNGLEVQDRCYVGGLHTTALSHDTSQTQDAFDPFHAPAFAVPLTFGCQTSLRGLFQTQLAAGIMGMNRADGAFWNQMSSSLGLSNQFGLCFSRSPLASRDGTDAGAMTLGGTDVRLHGTDMVYSSVSPGSGFYDVSIRQIYLRQGGGESAAHNATAKVVPLLTQPTSAIVDSGTTDTYFSRSLKRAFELAFKDLTGGTTYTHADVSLSEEQLHQLPTILIQLAGDVALNQAIAEGNKASSVVVGLAGDLDPNHPYDVVLAIPASHYYEYNDDDNTYTARFYVDNGGNNVIGANAMMGHEVFFDVDNDRIGWSESTCDYPALVEPYLQENGGQLFPGSTPAARQDHASPDSSSNGGDDSGHPTGGPAPENTPEGLCSSQCQFGVVTGVLLAGVLVLVVVVVRRGRPVYRMALTELELGELPSNVDQSDDLDDEISYRDHLTSQSYDEQETGILS